MGFTRTVFIMLHSNIIFYVLQDCFRFLLNLMIEGPRQFCHDGVCNPIMAEARQCGSMGLLCLVLPKGAISLNLRTINMSQSQNPL